MFPPRPEDDPDWNPAPAYVFDESVRIWEGLPQVKLLINSLVERELPSDILERADELSTEHQDHMMQRYFLQITVNNIGSHKTLTCDLVRI